MVCAMAWTTALRREIADEFESLIPTQWRLLLNGWMFKPSFFWSDDSGELSNRKCPSRSWNWQYNKRRRELARENSRFVMKCRRSANRREQVKKRSRCAGCNHELDHTSYHNVRKFCTPACRDALEKREYETRGFNRHMRETCLRCSRKMKPHYNKKFCTTDCRLKYRG